MPRLQGVAPVEDCVVQEGIHHRIAEAGDVAGPRAGPALGEAGRRGIQDRAGEIDVEVPLVAPLGPQWRIQFLELDPNPDLAELLLDEQTHLVADRTAV